MRCTGLRTGEATLIVDGILAGSTELPMFMSMMSSVGPSVGYDHGSPVSTRYEAPFAFPGAVHEIVIQLLSRNEVEAQRAEAAAEMSRQ